MASPRKDDIACSNVRTDPAEASESRLLEHDSTLIVGQACLALGSDSLTVFGMSFSLFFSLVKLLGLTGVLGR